MKRIKTSIVAWSGAFALAAFGILYQVLPYGQMLDLALSLALGAALATVIRYVIDAVRSVREGQTGTHFLIAAIFSIALVVLMQRVWGIVLRIYDRPLWLTDSAMTIFIPWMLAWSVSLAFIAPDVDDYNAGSRGGIWKSVALFIGGAIAGFVLAASFRVDGIVDASISMPSCHSSLPVMVSSKGVYHDAASPYRALVVPRRCYKTVEEAQKAGYRAPGG